jgi:hypothetical protein
MGMIERALEIKTNGADAPEYSKASEAGAKAKSQ